jgi:hypothetical protein
MTSHPPRCNSSKDPVKGAATFVTSPFVSRMLNRNGRSLLSIGIAYGSLARSFGEGQLKNAHPATVCPGSIADDWITRSNALLEKSQTRGCLLSPFWARNSTLRGSSRSIRGSRFHPSGYLVSRRYPSTPTALESLLVAFMYTIKSMSRASHPVRWPCILHYLKLITFYDGWYLDDKGRIPPVSHDWMPGWDCPQ